MKESTAAVVFSAFKINPFMPCGPQKRHWQNGRLIQVRRRSVRSESSFFALNTGTSIKRGNNKTNQTTLLLQMDW